MYTLLSRQALSPIGLLSIKTEKLGIEPKTHGLSVIHFAVNFFGQEALNNVALPTELLFSLVGPLGFEPRKQEPKSCVLPLHHGPI